MEQLPTGISHPNPAAAFDVVVVAASWGGLDALSQLLATLPPDFAASIILVQHLSPAYPSELDAILNRRSPLPVQWATHGARLCPRQVFVAPPDWHVRVRMNATL